MPVTRRGNPLYDNIDQTNAAGFLFRDDDSAMDSNYANLDTPGDEGFPKLIAQKDNPNRVSSFPNCGLPSNGPCWPITSLPLRSLRSASITVPLPGYFNQGPTTDLWPVVSDQFLTARKFCLPLHTFSELCRPATFLLVQT